MNLVYIGLLILMCAVSLSIFYCTLFYVAVKLFELLTLKLAAMKKASEESETGETADERGGAPWKRKF